MRWTADMLELTPVYCQKCERKVKRIIPQWHGPDEVCVRCGYCGYMLVLLCGVYNDQA
jgi:hypothetical protein